MFGKILDKVTFWRKGRTKKSVDHIRTRSFDHLSKEKQKKLLELCEQLFKKKEFITSGKLQFIGLSQIKSQMGRRWEGLCQIVYEIADAVLDEYLDRVDIFVRFKDDTYIIIFADNDPQLSNEKTNQIAEEIQKRLFALDEEELRDIEIRRAISAIRTDTLMEAGQLDAMFGAMDDDLGELDDNFFLHNEEEEPATLDDLKGRNVKAGFIKKKTKQAINIDPSELNFLYLPLWDTKRGALTTYLCVACNDKTTDNPLAEHRAIYTDKSEDEKMALDKAVLGKISAEFQDMKNQGVKSFIVCPVSHETLYDTENYEEYKSVLAEIPDEHRKYMFLLVMPPASRKKIKNPYWFAKALRTFCPGVMAEIPLQVEINLKYLSNSGVSAVGYDLDYAELPEKERFLSMERLGAKAKAMKIEQTFVLGVTNLSLTTSSVCAGYDYLGGPSIHEAVEKPTGIHQYQYADVVKSLTENQDS